MTISPTRKAVILILLGVAAAGCRPSERGQQQANGRADSPDSGPAIPPRPSDVQTTDAAAVTRRQRPLIENIRPYVLSLGGDHVTLCWMTQHECVGEVRLFDYDEQTRHAEESAGHMHRVHITDLTAGTTYRYEIGRNYTGSFRTADSTASFEVAVFGHPGGTEDPMEYPTELLHGQLLAIDPEIALCTGDITLDATMRGMRDTFLRRFDRYLASHPIYISPSNHEGRWNGHSYDVFRSLFPYDFGPETGGSYWFDYKHARFFALTYKLRTPELFREHVQWLADAIDNSDQEFNIVFLGGQEPKYYDKQMLFETLGSRPVDLVLGGDGGGTFQEKHSGVDFFFAGDGGMNAYPFYYLRFHAHHFDVRLQYADSSRPARNIRTFYSKKVRTKKIPLAEHAVESPAHILQFSDIGLPSAEVDAVHLTVEWPHAEDVELQMLIKADKGGPTKVQTHRITANSTTNVLIDIPTWNQSEPAGTEYVLDGLTIQLARHRRYHDRYDLQATVSDVYLVGK